MEGYVKCEACGQALSVEKAMQIDCLNSGPTIYLCAVCAVHKFGGKN